MTWLTVRIPVAQADDPPDADWSRERKIEYVMDQLKEYQTQFSDKTVKATVQAFGRRGVGNSKIVGKYEDEFTITTTFDRRRLRHRGWVRHVPEKIPWPGVLVRHDVYFDGNRVQKFHYDRTGVRLVDVVCHAPPTIVGVMATKT